MKWNDRENTMNDNLQREWAIHDARAAVIKAAMAYYRSKSTARHSDADILVAVAALIELEKGV